MRPKLAPARDTLPHPRRIVIPLDSVLAQAAPRFERPGCSSAIPLDTVRHTGHQQFGVFEKISRLARAIRQHKDYLIVVVGFPAGIVLVFRDHNGARQIDGVDQKVLERCLGGSHALKRLPREQRVAETSRLIGPRPNDQGREFIILVRNVSHFHVSRVSTAAAGLVFPNSSATWMTVSHDQALPHEAAPTFCRPADFVLWSRKLVAAS